MPSVAECFVAQSGPLTCVAACVAIVRTWRGEPTDEATVCRAWGPAPYALPVHAAAEGDHYALDPDEASSLEFLSARVAQGWVIVSVMAAPRRPAHAIVLVASDDGASFSYLDPAMPPGQQPRTIGEMELVKIWTGQTLVARR